MESGMQMTSQKLPQKNCQKQTVTVLDSLARVLALPESEADLKIQEELCSLNLPEYLKQNVLHFSSLKTFPLSERFKRGRFLRPSSTKYLDWGMCANGSVLTAQLTFPKAESGCSLSDILIPNVPEKYYLSKEKAQRLFPNSPTELHRETESMMQKVQP